MSHAKSIYYVALYQSIVALMSQSKSLWQSDTPAFNDLKRTIQFSAEPLTQQEANTQLTRADITWFQAIVLLSLLQVDHRTHYINAIEQTGNTLTILANNRVFTIIIGTWNSAWDAFFSYYTRTVFCVDDSLPIRAWCERIYAQLAYDETTTQTMADQLTTLLADLKDLKDLSTMTYDTACLILSSFPVPALGQYFDTIAPNFSQSLTVTTSDNQESSLASLFKVDHNGDITSNLFNKLSVFQSFFDKNQDLPVWQCCCDIMLKMLEQPTVYQAVITSLSQTLNQLVTPALGLYKGCNKPIKAMITPLSVSL